MRPVMRRPYVRPRVLSTGVATKSLEYSAKQVIFSQGDPGETVMYIQKGVVKLSVVSLSGQEAVLAILGPHDFLREGGMVGQSVRVETAAAVTPTTLLVEPYLGQNPADSAWVRFVATRTSLIHQSQPPISSLAD